ncbi:MAG: RtcB family protein [Spirochaetales bacterium]|nr:RtcB family protein [Spirochaetales bacterium]MCF7938413.1 RtcB family protein [Spirochaetales bacterium]
MTVDYSGKVPIKMWLDTIEEGALEQARNIANLPFVYKHVAIMPDAHQGYGMPIGGVMATNGTVVPNAVGVDIGCGMRASRTTLKAISPGTRKEILGEIRDLVPLGFNHQKTPQQWDGFDSAPDSVSGEELEKAKYQLGTLGGGNHFIELQKDQDGFIWIMIHSGSRNFGYQIAKKYHKLAKELCEQWQSEIPTTDLAFFPLETEQARDYIRDMNFALDFAKENRSRMFNAVLEAVHRVMGEFSFEDSIDIHHNYARMEHHFGKDVMVHRKGATSAYQDEIGIIPGSQGTKSYIVRGLGNPESFKSCSHGAGRKMGRKQAIRELNLEKEIQLMEEQGIVHGMRTRKDLDEAGGAYKDLDEVIENERDLVEVVTTLEPLAVLKG